MAPVLRSHDFVQDSVCLATQNSSAYAFMNCRRFGSGGLRTLGGVMQTISPQGMTSKRSPNKIGSLRNKHREPFAHEFKRLHWRLRHGGGCRFCLRRFGGRSFRKHSLKRRLQMSEPDEALHLQISRRSRASFCRRAKSSQVQNRADEAQAANANAITE